MIFANQVYRERLNSAYHSHGLALGQDGDVIKITGKKFVIEKGSQKIALLLWGFVW